MKKWQMTGLDTGYRASDGLAPSPPWDMAYATRDLASKACPFHAASAARRIARHG